MRESLEGGAFGAAGQTVLIEEYLTGDEVSVLALVDGETVVPLLPARDHKRIGDGDTGPNTGGMGAYAPTTLVDAAMLERIMATILRPTARALAERGIVYRGILYAGLILTADGPKVIEFNCRFGDPGNAGRLAAPRCRSARPLRRDRAWAARRGCVYRPLAQRRVRRCRARLRRLSRRVSDRAADHRP